jgi:UDP-N-acetylmuramate--alanine ligase
MKGVATDIGTIHFIGIGGIGMSGIAEVMHNLGYSVQGSDVAEGYVVEGLRKKRHQGDDRPQGREFGRCGGGGDIDRGQARQPEVELALEKRVPVVRRAEMLAELMRLKSTVAVAGTHGKTTTTSMIAACSMRAGSIPTVINGGIINAYGSNARLARATGWWSRRTRATAASCASMAPSRWSRISIPNISIIMAISTA